MAAGTKDDPWVLKTPPGTSEYTMYRDEGADPPALGLSGGVPRPSNTTSGPSTTCTPGWSSKATGSNWARPTRRRTPRREPSRRGDGRRDNPVGGWYGLRNGYRGRFGMYLPPLLEALGLAEVTHDPQEQPHACRCRATVLRRTRQDDADKAQEHGGKDARYQGDPVQDQT